MTVIISLLFSIKVKSIIRFLKKVYLIHSPVFSFNVAILIKSNQEKPSGTYNSELTSNLSKLIKDKNLEKIIKVHDYKDVYLLKTVKDAEEYRRKKDLDLIIWGDFSTDGLKKDGKDYSELNINFTYGHPDDKNGNTSKMVLDELRNVLFSRNYWTIIDSSIDDLRIINKNTFEISTYILGLSLLLFGKLTTSAIIFEKLVEGKVISNDPLLKGSIFHLINIYFILSLKEGQWKKEYIKCKEYCEKILELEPKNKLALMNLAFSEYKLGNTIQSEAVCSKLQNFYPSSPAAWVNIAFFRIQQENYKSAFKYYKKFKYINRDDIDFEILLTTEFLANHSDLFPDEPAYLYGSGILNYYFADKSIAIEDLNKFLKKANKEKYLYMYREAKRLLNN